MAIIYYNKDKNDNCVVHKSSNCAKQGFKEFYVTSNSHAEEAKRRLVEENHCKEATKCNGCF